MYSHSDFYDFNNIIKINELFKLNYSKILTIEFFFAQDIFGNQFGFSANGIVFFNIETGDKEYLCDTFDDWVEVLMSDIEYYSGINTIISWEKKNSTINFNERLSPKLPFVAGGEYEIENLYVSPFPNYIFSNANIANQVYNLAESTPIKLKASE